MRISKVYRNIISYVWLINLLDQAKLFITIQRWQKKYNNVVKTEMSDPKNYSSYKLSGTYHSQRLRSVGKV